MFKLMHIQYMGIWKENIEEWAHMSYVKASQKNQLLDFMRSYKNKKLDFSTLTVVTYQLASSLSYWIIKLKSVHYFLENDTLSYGKFYFFVVFVIRCYFAGIYHSSLLSLTKMNKT